jgi:hypothetical protein
MNNIFVSGIEWSKPSYRLASATVSSNRSLEKNSNIMAVLGQLTTGLEWTSGINHGLGEDGDKA